MIWFSIKKFLYYCLVSARNQILFSLPIIFFTFIFSFVFQNTFVLKTFPFLTILFSSFFSYLIFYFLFKSLVQNEILNFWRKKRTLSFPLQWWQKLTLFSIFLLFLYFSYSSSIFFIFFIPFFINYELYSNEKYKNINLTSSEKPLISKNILKNTLKLSQTMKFLFTLIFIYFSIIIFISYYVIYSKLSFSFADFFLNLTNFDAYLNEFFLLNYMTQIKTAIIMKYLNLFFSIIICAIIPSAAKEQVNLTVSQLEKLSKDYNFNSETPKYKPSKWFW